MTNGNGKSSELDMLIKLMGMTGSSSDNEALNALRLANKWLAGKGQTWDDLLRGKVTVEADPFAAAPSVSVNVHTAQPRYAASAPPPPPKMFNDIKEIEGYFDKLDLKMKLPISIMNRINSIRKEWQKNGFLLYGDYDYLKKNAKSRLYK